MKHIQTTKGFSIGEVLLAIFVLTVGVVAAVRLTQQNIVHVAQSRDVVIASMLAQEGVELVRNARDNNAAQRYFDKRKNPTTPQTWRSVFKGFNVSKCFFDYTDFYNDTLGLSCNSIAGLDHAEDGFYRSTADGKFKRHVVLKHDNHRTTDESDDSYTVTSIVVWGDENLPDIAEDCSLAGHCVFAQNVLTSWISIDK